MKTAKALKWVEKAEEEEAAKALAEEAQWKAKAAWEAKAANAWALTNDAQLAEAWAMKATAMRVAAEAAWDEERRLGAETQAKRR